MFSSCSDSNSSSTEDVVEVEKENMTPSPSHNTRHRGSKEFLIPKLFATLDKCQISDRDAVHIILSIGEALTNDVSKLIIHSIY